MKLVICGVFDGASQLFGRPFFVVATGQAIRSFKDEVNKKDGNDFANHPEDYNLYCFGAFDDSNGSFDCSAPELLVRGKDVVEGAK